MTAGDRIFRARALAQAHPLSPAANRYVNATVADERLNQPQAEIGIWAGYGLTAGYCLRRVEEIEVLGAPIPPAEENQATLDESATDIAARIRTVGAHEHYLLPETVLVAELDGIIGGEIDRRLEHWRETVDDATFEELSQYIAWWVIKGYALRVAETRHV